MEFTQPSVTLSCYNYKDFTFRGLNDFKEDVLYRNVEPALSFQLELNRDGMES